MIMITSLFKAFWSFIVALGNLIVVGMPLFIAAGIIGEGAILGGIYTTMGIIAGLVYFIFMAALGIESSILFVIISIAAGMIFSLPFSYLIYKKYEKQ